MKNTSTASLRSYLYVFIIMGLIAFMLPKLFPWPATKTASVSSAVRK